MKNVIIVFIGCILSSCSLTGSEYNNPNILKAEKEAGLYNIRIERWGKIRFSGILALQQRKEGLSYVLLDATGVTLIEAEVSLSGDHRLIRANGSLKISQLPHYLSTSLKRIYLLDPLQSPCDRTLFFSFCKEPSGAQEWQKYVQAGPFTVWKVEKSERDGGKEETTVYSQPWLGVRIALTELK